MFRTKDGHHGSSANLTQMTDQVQLRTLFHIISFYMISFSFDTLRPSGNQCTNSLRDLICTRNVGK